MTEQALTQEQVLAQLQTRGFETGGFASPLRYFRGKLDSITGSMVQRGTMPQARLEVSYNFSEVEVFESTEPYPYPIAQISLLHSNRDKSGMGVLGQSMDKIINAGVGANIPQAQTKNQDFLIGKVQEWKITPGHMMWNRDENRETPRDCWEVTYIEGVGGTPYSGAQQVADTQQPTTFGTATPVVTPDIQAMNLLDGRTMAEWQQAVFQDPIIRDETAGVKTKIINQQFIPPLEAAGLVTKDDNGVYHVNK